MFYALTLCALQIVFTITITNCSTQRRQTYASRVDFDSFTVLCVYFDAKNLKGSLQPTLKGTDVWPLNARSKVATG